MRLLQERDEDFDVVRSFLVASMIFAHVFEVFYRPDYNRALTAYVTIGFVFISGLTNSVLRSHLIYAAPNRYFVRSIRPFGKLLGLFFLSNLLILTCLPHRLGHLASDDIWGLLLAVFLGTQQKVFGFDILVPIAFTALMSWPMLAVLRFTGAAILSVALIFLLYAIELYSFCDYFGSKLILIGLLGSSLGRIVSDVEWGSFRRILSGSKAILAFIAFTALYLFSTFLIFERNEPIRFSYHVIPCIVILLFVYEISFRTKFATFAFVKIATGAISKHILFAYLFHILDINLLFLLLRKDSLGFLESALLGFALLLFNIWVCRLIDISNSKYAVLARVYAMVFRP